MSLSYVWDQNVIGHNSANNGNQSFLRYISVTWHFRKCKLFFFEYPEVDEQFAAIFKKIGVNVFFNPTQSEYLPMTFEAKRQKYLSYLKIVRFFLCQDM